MWFSCYFINNSKLFFEIFLVLIFILSIKSNQMNKLQFVVRFQNFNSNTAFMINRDRVLFGYYFIMARLLVAMYYSKTSSYPTYFFYLMTDYDTQ